MVAAVIPSLGDTRKTLSSKDFCTAGTREKGGQLDLHSAVRAKTTRASRGEADAGHLVESSV
jgi:hypothetical protein